MQTGFRRAVAVGAALVLMGNALSGRSPMVENPGRGTLLATQETANAAHASATRGSVDESRWQADPLPGPIVKASIADVVARLNTMRRQAGLGPLILDPSLCALAQGNLDAQAAAQTVRHLGTRSPGFFVSECIAYEYPILDSLGEVPERSVRMLDALARDSPPHRELLLQASRFGAADGREPMYVGVGVGLCGEYQGELFVSRRLAISIVIADKKE